MARKLPRSTEVVFAAEGHMPPIERPQLDAREILSLLATTHPSTWLASDLVDAVDEEVS